MRMDTNAVRGHTGSPERVKEKEDQHTVTLHDGEELDDDLGGRADQDLALASFLGYEVLARAIDRVGGEVPLLIALRASLRTDVLTILAVLLGDSRWLRRLRYLHALGG